MFNDSIKRITVLISIITLVIILSSCGPLPFSRLGRDQVKLISVSVKTGSVSSSLSIGRYLINEMTDDTYLKPALKVSARGTLVNSFTPEEFILDQDFLKLYKGEEDAQLSPLLTTPEGYIIPRHVNIIYANDFIRNFEITRQQWDGLYMQFLPGIGGTSPMNMRVMSIVGIDLGTNYNGIFLSNEKTTPEIPNPKPGLHYFEFSSLQPYNVDFLSYLIIGNDIKTEGIQNPTSSMPTNGSWDLPGSDTTSGNASMIFIPGSEIDFFSYKNPKVVFNWDVEDLVQVYDNGTSSNYNDDIVTFNLTNPFPVSITVEESTNQSTQSDSSDVTSPDEVSYITITGSSKYNVLIWINPTDKDFEKIVIVRKTDSTPVNKDDGEVVYEGYEPNFCDLTGTPGAHYYYKVFTVDYNANYSSGSVVDRVIQ